MDADFHHHLFNRTNNEVLKLEISTVNDNISPFSLPLYMELNNI